MTDRVDFESRLLDSMLEQRRDADGRLVWEYAPPYLLRHAIEHAANVNRVDELLVDPELLSCADPAGVVPTLDDASTSEAIGTTAVYRASLHRHRDADASIRRDLLALDATRLGQRDFGQRLIERSRSGWMPRWGTGSKVSPAQRDALDDLGGAVSVAVCTAAEDAAGARRRTTAFLGGAAATTAVWDLKTGERIGPYPGQGDPENDLHIVDAATLLRDGLPYAAAVDTSGKVRLWNLSSGYPLYSPFFEFPENHSAVRIAVGYPGGEPVLVVASSNGSVAVVDALTGDTRRMLTTGQDRGAHALLVAQIEGAWSAAAVYADRTLVWDLASFEEIAYIPMAEASTVCAAWWQTSSREDFILLGDDRTLRCWNLEAGHPWELDAPARSVAITEFRGRPVAVVGGCDGTLRVWDLLLREPVHRPWPVSRNAIEAVTITDRNGRKAVLTGDGEGAARLWDLELVMSVEQPAIGHLDDVTALLTTSRGSDRIVLTGGGPKDPVVRARRLGDGAVAGPPWEGHHGPVRALVHAEIDGTRYLLAGCDDGVRVHELETGRPVGTLWECAVRSLAVGRIRSPDGPATRTVGVVGDAYGRWSVWDVLTGASIHSVQLDDERSIMALQVAAGPEGDTVVAGLADGTLRQWDLATGSELAAPVTAHDHHISSLTLAECGGWIAISGSWRQDRIGVTRLSERQPLYRPLRVSHKGVLALATGTHHEERVILAGRLVRGPSVAARRRRSPTANGVARLVHMHVRMYAIGRRTESSRGSILFLGSSP